MGTQASMHARPDSAWGCAHFQISLFSFLLPISGTAPRSGTHAFCQTLVRVADCRLARGFSSLGTNKFLIVIKCSRSVCGVSGSRVERALPAPDLRPCISSWGLGSMSFRAGCGLRLRLGSRLVGGKGSCFLCGRPITPEPGWKRPSPHHCRGFCES